MHLAFVDIMQAYAADRPDQDASFGGTNTAVCFLARALAGNGVACTLFNRTQEPLEACGIKTLPVEHLIDARADPAYSAFVFCGRWSKWMVDMVRQKTSAPLIAWMHESSFNSELTPALTAFDGVVFVSEWQERINRPHFLRHWKRAVIRNAMNPAFARMFAAGESILAAKTAPPVLFYAGATPRGVLYLPLLLKHLRAYREDFSVEIYSNCAPTSDPAVNAECLAQMKGVPGVTHVGLVGQRELARRMKRASVLISPNPWPETSCITLIEALAAGMCAVTTDRAALPETAAGFARHIPIAHADHPVRFDMPMPIEAFAEAVNETLGQIAKRDAELEARLRRQVDYFGVYYPWTSRAAAWVDYIDSFVSG